MRRAFAVAFLVVLPNLAFAGEETDFDRHLERARVLAARAGPAGDREAAREAFAAFEAAAALRPADPVPPAESGLLALDLGDGAALARHLARAQEAGADSGAYRFLRGSVLLRREEYEDALEEFAAAKAAGYRPSVAADRWFEAKVGHGLQLAASLRFEQAVEVLKESVALKPDHPLVPRAWLEIGLAYRRLRSPEEAEKALRVCAGRFPSYAPASAELGELLSERGRNDEALEVLDRTVKADPDFARGWLLRAVALTGKGEFAGADRAFLEFEKRFPPSGESEMRRGVYFLRVQEPEKALARLRRGLELDPSRSRCLYHMSFAYRDLGMEEEAARAMEQFRKAEEAAQHGRPEGVRKASER